MIKFNLENKFTGYFLSVRRGVWLIIIPAFFIIILKFVSTFNAIVIEKEHSPIIDYEKKFAALKKDLPRHEFVNFVSNQKYPGDYFAARYVLIPARLIRGLEPPHNYLVVHSSDPTKFPTIEGYALQKDYGNGVMLFSGSDD
jgi:hypothetical protein